MYRNPNDEQEPRPSGRIRRSERPYRLDEIQYVEEYEPARQVELNNGESLDSKPPRGLTAVALIVLLVTLVGVVLSLQGITGWSTVPKKSNVEVTEQAMMANQVEETDESATLKSANGSEENTQIIFAPVEVSEEPKKAESSEPEEEVNIWELNEMEPDEPNSETAETTETGTVRSYAYCKPTGKKIAIALAKEHFEIDEFTYVGGYILEDDPWFAEEKETPESYGPSLRGETVEEGLNSWLRTLPKSPHQIVRLLVQTGQMKLTPLKCENDYAYELVELPAEEYDEKANEALKFVFEQLENGRIATSTDWNLENYMIEEDEDGQLALHGRLNGDDDREKEEKDLLITLYNSDGKNFVSDPLGLKNTAEDAKQNPANFSNLAWINLDEGGTWKWKLGGKASEPTAPPAPDITPTPAPATPTPTSPPPTPTPTTPPPTPTPTTPAPSTPTPTPHPTKDPEQRPTVSDAPVGGGETDPEHATDPKTTSAPTSTPKVETPTPKPTPKPTAVPTAVVRPTENCEVPAPTPIREDKNTPPPPEPNHNVPTQEPATAGDPNNTTDFDPDSI